jgi:hypothetical protein
MRFARYFNRIGRDQDRMTFKCGRLTVKRRVRSAPLHILLITSSVPDCGMVPLNAILCPRITKCSELFSWQTWAHGRWRRPIAS